MFERVILRAMNGQHKGKEFVLENEADYTLGRARDCSFVVDDPLYLVSRRHCRIEVHAPFVRIQDLGSRNGTLLNGTRIGPCAKRRLIAEVPHEEHEEHSLEDGDTLAIAGYEFRVAFEPKPLRTASELPDQEKLCSSDYASN